MNKIHIAFLAALMTLFSLPRTAFADDPGYALQFDGVSDFVRLSATSTMMASGWESSKTVSLWVKPTGAAVCTAPSPSSCDAIFGDRPRTWGISRGTLGGDERIWIWNYDGTFDSVGIEYTVGQWTQVALVHDGGLLSAYKDGVLVGSVPSGATIQGGAQPVLQLGGIINNASRNWTFEGEIDEVRIWNAPRSEVDLQADLNRLLTGNEVGLAAYYQMSNGSGASITDDSGHGWTGSLEDGGSGVPADGPISWVPSGAFSSGNPNNVAPVANPQVLMTDEDTAIGIQLTGSDPDEDNLNFTVVSLPSFGSLTGTAPDLTYVPNANFNGPDAFSFIVHDGWVGSAPATVSITVIPVNDQPSAQADSAITSIDTPVNVDVLANDFDIDGDTLTIASAGPAFVGTVANNGGDITYTPLSGFTGSDSFTYTVSDGAGGMATGEVSVTVTPASEGPGYALRFDGTSDFVKIGTTAAMMPGGWESTKTVSLWVKPTGVPFCSVPSPTHCDAIFGDRPRWWGISRGVINGLDQIWVWNYDGNLDAIPVDVTPDEWVHVALVHGNGILSGYKNGVLVGSVASGPTTQPNTGAFPTLHFGGIINNTSRNWTFEGDLDELRIWSHARTALEIGQDMNRSLIGTESGLIAYYRMSDGSGVSLTDDTGNGWTGEMHDGGQGVPADGEIQWVTSGAFGSAP